MKGLSLSLGFDFTWKRSSSVGGSLIIFGGLCTTKYNGLWWIWIFEPNWKTNLSSKIVKRYSFMPSLYQIHLTILVKCQKQKRTKLNNVKYICRNNISYIFVIQLKELDFGLQTIINLHLYLIYITISFAFSLEKEKNVSYI